MVDSLVVGEGECTASSNINSRGASTSGATDVASQVGIRQRSDGRVVVGVLADMLIFPVLGATDTQVLGHIVARHGVGGQRKGRDNSEALHDGGFLDVVDH